MSKHENELHDESLKETIIEDLTRDQEDVLKNIHSFDYMGTDDDMSENYKSWLENLSLEELESMLSIKGKVISDKTGFPKQVTITEDDAIAIKWAFETALLHEGTSAYTKSIISTLITKLEK